MKDSNLKVNLAKVAVASAMAISVSCTISGCESKQVKELKELLDSGAYSDAAFYYQTNRDKLMNEDLDETINTSADNIYNSYLSGVVDTATAKTQMLNLKEIGSDESDKYIDSKVELIDSTDNFRSGESYMDQGDYLKAIEYFNLVVEADPNYSAAQSKIKEAEKSYVADIVAKADNYISNGDYSGAVNYLKNYLDKVSDNKAIQDKIAEAEKGYVDSIVAKAENYINESDYSGAINYLKGYLDKVTDNEPIKAKISEYQDKMLDVLLTDVDTYVKNGDYYNALAGIAELEKDYGESQKLKDLKASTEKSYIEMVIPLIDDFVKKKDYVSAYSLCKNAMEVIADSDELQKRYDQIEPLKPALLNEMKISESEYFEQLTDHTVIYEDVTGHTYGAGNLYRLHLHNDGWGSSEQGYAKIYLNAQYTKMTGVLTMDDSSDIGDCVVTILVDDKKVFQEKFNRSSEPKKVDIDVKGKQWVQLMISYPEQDSESSSSESQTYTSDMLVSNFAFTK